MPKIFHKLNFPFFHFRSPSSFRHGELPASHSKINIKGNTSLDASRELNFSAKEECCFVIYNPNGVSRFPSIGRCYQCITGTATRPEN